MTMPVAFDQAGRLIAISAAKRGLACACTCISCGERVIARKGLLRGHHFAHYSSKESCSIKRETLLHLYAKEVICEALGIQLPAQPGVNVASEDGTSWWDFQKVSKEVAQPGFQPDLVAELRGGNQLFIEIAVTSFIDEEKCDRIRALGVPTIEIDLSSELQSDESIPSEQIKHRVLHQTDNRKWVWPQAPSAATATQLAATSETPSCQPELQKTERCEQRFTIMKMWVSARTLPSGSIAVRSWSFSPQVSELLKKWRNELGGEYNPKYRNWVFGAAHHDDVLARLEALHE